MNAEIREVSCVSVISRLNSNKQVASGLVRALNAENKVFLMFVQGKHQQRSYIRQTYIEVKNQQASYS